MNRFDSRQYQRVQHLVEQLHELGPRAATEFVFDLDQRIGTGPAICNLLEEYTNHSNPALLRAIGGDRFPRHINVVPDSMMNMEDAM